MCRNSSLQASAWDRTARTCARPRRAARDRTSNCPSAWPRLSWHSVQSRSRPICRDSRGVFDFDGKAHQIGLKVSLLVDRAFALGVALVDYKHRLLRPLATLEKLLVGPPLYEDVGEHLGAAGSGV